MLLKYRSDISILRKENDEIVSNMKLTYEEELARLRQEKAELKNLIQATHQQAGVALEKNKNLKTNFKKREEKKKYQLNTVLDNYTSDCVRLVMDDILNILEKSQGETKTAFAFVEIKNHKSEIKILRNDNKKMKEEIELLQDELVKAKSQEGRKFYFYFYFSGSILFNLN